MSYDTVEAFPYFFGDEDPENWLYEYYLTALDAGLSEIQMLQYIECKLLGEPASWFDTLHVHFWHHFVHLFFEKYCFKHSIKKLEAKCKHIQQRQNESTEDYFIRYSIYLDVYYAAVHKIQLCTTSKLEYLLIDDYPEVQWFVSGMENCIFKEYIFAHDHFTMEEVKLLFDDFTLKLKFFWQKHDAVLVSSSCNKSNGDTILSNKAMEEEVISLPDISCKPTCLNVLVESKLESSLLKTEKQLEAKAKEESTVISANSTTDLDNIIDILDLYLTSIDSHPDTTTTTVNDEEQVQLEVSLSESATVASLTTTPTIDGIIETITQNNTVTGNTTADPLESGFYSASFTEEIDAVEYIPVISILLKHYLPLLLELGIVLFKFKIILLTFLRVPAELLSKLSAITLNYLELLNSQQSALFYAASPPTFIYKRF
jgi:hypothetical protein